MPQVTELGKWQRYDLIPVGVRERASFVPWVLGNYAVPDPLGCGPHAISKGDVSWARKTKDWGCPLHVTLWREFSWRTSPPQTLQQHRRCPPPGCPEPGRSLQQRTETGLSLKREDVGREVAGSFPCQVSTVPTPPGRTLPSSFLLDPAGQGSWVFRQFFTAFEH